MAGLWKSDWRYAAFDVGSDSAQPRSLVNGSSKALRGHLGGERHLVKAGIIDPTKVVRVALHDAASVAAMIITTEAGIVERSEKKGNRCERLSFTHILLRFLRQFQCHEAGISRAR